MNEEYLMTVIKKPIISEKATLLSDKCRQFIFEVDSRANSAHVRQAVELLFKVKVCDVRVCNVKGKKKTFKQRSGQRKNWKKAYVALKEGSDIDFASQ